MWHLPGPRVCTALTASPVVWIFAPLVSTPGEISLPCSALLCLQLGPQRGSAGGGNQTRPSWPLCFADLPRVHSETVNHPELLTGFVILNRAWTQLSRGESTMSYCNSFCQPILSWTQQYFNLKIQPQTHSIFSYCISSPHSWKQLFYFFNHRCFSKVNHKPWILTDRKDPEINPLSLSWGL